MLIDPEILSTDRQSSGRFHMWAVFGAWQRRQVINAVLLSCTVAPAIWCYVHGCRNKLNTDHVFDHIVDVNFDLWSCLYHSAGGSTQTIDLLDREESGNGAYLFGAFVVSKRLVSTATTGKHECYSTRLRSTKRLSDSAIVQLTASQPWHVSWQPIQQYGNTLVCATEIKVKFRAMCPSVVQN